jgi:hypothetical protein
MGNIANYIAIVTPSNYTPYQSLDKKTYSHPISVKYDDGASGTISLTGGVTVTVTLDLLVNSGITNFYFTDARTAGGYPSGNSIPFSISADKTQASLSIPINHLSNQSTTYYFFYTYNTSINNAVTANDVDPGTANILSVSANSVTSPGSNPQSVTYYTSVLSDPQPCLYYLTSSQQLVFSNIIATYYGKIDFTFNSYSDPAYTSSLFQSVNTPFNINLGDQVHFYTSSLGWSEKEEYVIAYSYVSGSGTNARLYAKLNRGLNLNLLSQATVDVGSNSDLKACRFIVLKHVPDETNLILRYAPTTNILQDGLVFPQYIEQPVKDNSGNVIKSLKSQNLI